MISAEVILGSTSPYAKPIYTLKTRYPWFIHGEVMTHRVFSRNASSNRAIPLAKMLEEVENANLRAEPVFWGAEQKGMSPGDELPDYPPTGGKYPFVSPRMEAQIAWANAAHAAAERARRLATVGTHKSICNRLLMPFAHANVIITSTEWENFFGLRLDKAADPTMRALAEAMWVAINEYKTQALSVTQWHLPFVDDVEDENAIKISVARCARVSYESFETGKRSTVEEDLRLYDKLMGAQPLHASPAEHQATPDVPYVETWQCPELHGNFVGWVQYRKTLKGESVAPLPKEYTWKSSR